MSEDDDRGGDGDAISSMLLFGSGLMKSEDSQASDISIGDQPADANVAELSEDTSSISDNDDAPDALRSELASIFGISITEENRSSEDIEYESDDTQQVAVEDIAQPEEGIADEDESETEAADAPSEKSISDSGFDFSEGGDDAVQRYMEQLLARTRGNREGSHEDSESSKPTEQEEIEQESSDKVIAAEAFVAVSEESDIQAASDVEVAAPKPAVPKREPQSRERVRENLNSFRKVANTSARSALAKSTLVRQRLVFQTFTVFTCVSLVTTVVFSIIDWWSGASLQEFSIASGMISAVLCVYLAYCLSRIKHLENIEKATLDSNEEKS